MFRESGAEDQLDATLREARKALQRGMSTHTRSNVSIPTSHFLRSMANSLLILADTAVRQEERTKRLSEDMTQALESARDAYQAELDHLRAEMQVMRDGGDRTPDGEGKPSTTTG
jgi:hypothetical protein